MAALPILLFYYVGLTSARTSGHRAIAPWARDVGAEPRGGRVAMYLLRANLRERPIPVVALVQQWFWAAVAWASAWAPDAASGAPAAAPPSRRGAARGSGGSSEQRAPHRRPVPEREFLTLFFYGIAPREGRGDHRRPDDDAGAVLR